MDSQKRRKNSLRLQGYDYTWDGAYFVTICTHERQHIFGAISDGQMSLNTYGSIVEQEWKFTLDKRSYIQCPAFVVTPNHFHAIVVLDYQEAVSAISQPNTSESVGARRASPKNVTGAPSQSLGAVIGSFKSAVTKRIRQDTEGSEIWQRGYHDIIIRTEESYNQILTYILNNPVHWEHDSLFSSEQIFNA